MYDYGVVIKSLNYTNDLDVDDVDEDDNDERATNHVFKLQLFKTSTRKLFLWF